MAPSPTKETLVRSGSRRGFSISAVSPSSASSQSTLVDPVRDRRQSMISLNRLSTTSDDLEQDGVDLDGQLRLLAAKEMELVELRDRRRELDTQINANEKQLYRLRDMIQRSLYQSMSPAGPVQTPTPSRQSSVKRRPRNNSEDKRRSGVDERWSVFFDDSPLRHKPEELVAQINHVSSSLLTFVNDMKSGILQSLSEEDTMINNSDDDLIDATDLLPEDDVAVDFTRYKRVRNREHPYVAYTLHGQ